MRRAVLTILTLGLLATSLGACGGSSDSATVTLVAHDSFAVSKPVLRDFTRQTGYKVRVLKSGDAGQALNQVILTDGKPVGDALFGVDNTFLTRALDRKVFVKYRSAAQPDLDPRYVIDPTGHATSVDFGDVCVNFDKAWFAQRDLPVPQTLDDLADARYRGQLVVENPSTSSPGLAFLLATVARYGEQWPTYWQRLKANGVQVVDGWEQAYNSAFSAGAGKGDRPLVVSYASSPPAEVYYAKPQPTEAPTGVVLDTCFRQIETVGVLRGAKNPAGAKALVDFMLSRRFQEDVPLQMFVFPARRGTTLPPVFAQYAVVPSDPGWIPPAQIGAHREQWLRQWNDTVLR